MNLINTRDTYPSPNVAQGLLVLEDGTILETLQRDPNPAGTYQLVPHTMKGGALDGLETWAMVNPDLGCFAYPNPDYVDPGGYPMRFGLCIHYGNWPQDSEGCIMVGAENSRNTVPPSPSIGASHGAFEHLDRELGGAGTTGHTITIAEPA